jgi:hypothetical protein
MQGLINTNYGGGPGAPVVVPKVLMTGGPAAG